MTRHERRLNRLNDLLQSTQLLDRGRTIQQIEKERARIVRHYNRVLRKKVTLFTPIREKESFISILFRLFFPAKYAKRKARWMIVWVKYLTAFYDRYFHERYSIHAFIGLDYDVRGRVKAHYIK
jgi:hypothetical protein